MYRNRYLERKISQYRAHFPVLLVIGARQVGKTTLLEKLLSKECRQITFDPVLDVGQARQDPYFFLDQHPPPIILDEIQYAPELLSAIKRRVDGDPKPGQYFLTGSQNPALLKNVSESLAGRVMIFEMQALSLAERCGAGAKGGWVEDLFQKDAAEKIRVRQLLPSRDVEATLFSRVWRGGFPRLLDLPDAMLADIFSSYVRTCIERDIRLLAEVQDQQLFSRFLSLCAALTAQEVNRHQLGRELGMTSQTAQRWLSLLKATFQWIEIPAFHGNVIKRISSHPKGYVADTGLASYLQRISSPEALSGHPLQGALFETHVVLDIQKQATLCKMAPQFYHWRAHSGGEVDLLLERDGLYVPVEIKSAARISAGDTRGIRSFRQTYPGLNHGLGIIVAAVAEPFLLSEDILVIPYDLA
ncbi:MAG: ATP-binding protein [Verrucomicrobiae bacterium]|nr:ATP-binding protein [Verrucomicrobiae bacterium]